MAWLRHTLSLDASPAWLLEALLWLLWPLLHVSLAAGAALVVVLLKWALMGCGTCGGCCGGSAGGGAHGLWSAHVQSQELIGALCSTLIDRMAVPIFFSALVLFSSFFLLRLLFLSSICSRRLSFTLCSAADQSSARLAVSVCLVSVAGCLHRSLCLA